MLDSTQRQKLLDTITQNWKEELVAARMYRSLAQQVPDPKRREILTLMALSEEDHAALWSGRLQELGVTVDPRLANEPFRKEHAYIATLGVGGIVRRIEQEERDHVTEYHNQIRALNDPQSTAILERVIPDERAHAEKLHQLLAEETGLLEDDPLFSLRLIKHSIGVFWGKQSNEAKAAFLSGVGLFAGALSSGSIISNVLYVLAMIAGSIPAVREAREALQKYRLDVELLMIAAAFGAACIGRPAEGALLMFLFALSGALEEFSMGRTRSAIRRLIGMRPQQARNADGSMRAVEEVVPGDRILVHPGEAIPLDGIVREGESSVDQRAMTGEAEPMLAQPGSEVLGGTLNLDGVLLVEARTAIGDSALERVIKLVREAQDQTALASSERLADRAGKYYTPAVLCVCLAWFIWLIAHSGFSIGAAAYRALALLIGASPCALVLSAPAAVLAALAGAGQRGILIRSGAVLEKLATITSFAFDKTGTLTTGIPETVEIWASNADENQLISFAAAAEAPSPHPHAKAMVNLARQRKLPLAAISGHQTVAGKGVEAEINGIRIRVGSPEWIIDARLAEKVQSAQAKGLSVICAAWSEHVGLVAFRDAARADAEVALRALKELGFENFTVLTGDHALAAQHLSERLSIPHCRAGLNPEQKAGVIADLRRQGEKVAMVGDGINDGPALVHATVGITLGGIASDVALDSAGVVVMEDRLTAVPEMITLARKARIITLQNLSLSMLSVAALTLTVILHGMPLPLAVVGHEGTTVLVVLNGLRLLKKS